MAYLLAKLLHFVVLVNVVGFEILSPNCELGYRQGILSTDVVKLGFRSYPFVTAYNFELSFSIKKLCLIFRLLTLPFSSHKFHFPCCCAAESAYAPTVSTWLVVRIL